MIKSQVPSALVFCYLWNESVFLFQGKQTRYYRQVRYNSVNVPSKGLSIKWENLKKPVSRCIQIGHSVEVTTDQFNNQIRGDYVSVFPRPCSGFRARWWPSWASQVIDDPDEMLPTSVAIRFINKNRVSNKGVHTARAPGQYIYLHASIKKKWKKPTFECK